MAPPAGLADLPPTIFGLIIDMIWTPNNRPLYGHKLEDYESQGIRRQTLRSLSVVSEGVRKLAQPVIFNRASIVTGPHARLSSTDRLAQLFEARPESTTWPKSLSLHVDDRLADDAPVLASPATLLSRLTGLQSLSVSGDQSWEVMVDAPSQLFSSITSLNISGASLTSASRFCTILSRCPNLTSLNCGSFEDPNGIEIPTEAIPLLSQLTAPMQLARLLILGRPVNSLTIASRYNLGTPLAYSPADLEPLAMGSKPIRKLDVSVVQWNHGCLQEIAAMFPSLEQLSLRVEPSYDGWLEKHLAEVIPLFPCLQSMKVTAKGPAGPPSEETLDEQLEVLKAARSVQPRLTKVAFLEDVTWVADDTGVWTALYPLKWRAMCLTPMSDTLVPGIRNSQPPVALVHAATSINHDDQPGNLPAELLLRIITFLRQAAVPTMYGPDHTYYGTLKALCLTSRTWRSLAQPFLFHKVSLTGIIRETLFVSKKLEKLFAAREGSALWVHHLTVKWDRPLLQSRDLPDDPEMAELGRMVSRLLSMMRNLRALHVSQLSLPYEAFTQLHQLRRLQEVVADGITFVHPHGVEKLDVGALTITDLMISDPSRDIGGDPPVDPCVAGLAQSPSLRKLHIRRLTPQTVDDILGPKEGSSLNNLETLKISDPQSPFNSLISLAPSSPNLRVLSLWTLCYDVSCWDPEPVISLPSFLSDTIWPHLTEFRGSIPSAHLFVPGRPVTKITVLGGVMTDMQWNRLSLVPLARGSALVKELAVYGLLWRDESVEEIARLFPQLEVLKILCMSSGDPDWLMHNLLHVARLLPRLRVLAISVAGQRPDFHAPSSKGDVVPMLQETRRLCASLTEVIFGPYSRWKFEGRGGPGVDCDGIWVHEYRGLGVTEWRL